MEAAESAGRGPVADSPWCSINERGEAVRLSARGLRWCVRLQARQGSEGARGRVRPRNELN